MLHDTHPASVFALRPLLEWLARQNRLAVETGHPPVVVRDYSFLLPPKSIPDTGLGPVVASVVDELPRFARSSPRCGRQVRRLPWMRRVCSRPRSWAPPRPDADVPGP